MKKTNGLLMAIALAAVNAQASVILSDSFPTNGPLVGTTPSIGGTWTENSGTAGTLVVTGNQLIINDDATQDAYSNFSSSQTGDVYVSFTLNGLADVSSSGAGAYFAAFMNGTSYVGRLFSLSDTASTYRLAVAAGTSTTPTSSTVTLTTGVSYTVVMKFTQNGSSDSVSLWIDPANEASTSVVSTAAAASTSVSGWGFRQTTATGDYAIDNLKAGTTFLDVVPEPGTAGIFLGATCLMFSLRRRTLRA